jgi:hypothetical protein
MRKYLSMMFVLMLAATIGLSACAKKEEPPPPPPPPPAAAPADNAAPAAPAAPARAPRHQAGRGGAPGPLLISYPVGRQEALDSSAAGVVPIFRFSCSCPSVDQSAPGGVPVSWNL